MTNGCSDADSAGRKLLDAGVWTTETVFSIQGGQGMHFQVTNISNSIGTTCTISDQFGQSESRIILPFTTADYLFTRFGNEPMGWTFTITTLSDVFIVGWCLYSTWIPTSSPQDQQSADDDSPSQEASRPKYVLGSFVSVNPNNRVAGSNILSSDQKAILQIVNASDIGLGGTDCDLAAVFTGATTGKQLCQPICFSIANGQGGATFSPVQPASSLGIILSAGPGIGGNPGSEFLMKFAELGSPQSPSFDIECFMTIPNANVSVIPRAMVSPDAKIALVIDANRFGTTPGRARLFNLQNRANPIGSEVAFDGVRLTALVFQKTPNQFAVRILTGSGATEILLP